MFFETGGSREAQPPSTWRTELRRGRDAALAARARPLVMRCGAFGDTVLLTALLWQLHRRLGQPVDLISSGPWCHPLLDGHPALGELFVLDSRRAPYWLSPDQRRLVGWLRARGPSPTWFCDPDVGRELLARGGIPDPFSCDMRTLDLAPGESFAEHYVRAGNASPPAFAGLIPGAIAPTSRSAQLHISGDRRALDSWLARHGLACREIVVVHPGNRRTARGGRRRRSSNTKYWPESRWAQVLRAIRDVLPEHAIVLSGTQRELGLNADIARAAGISSVHNAAGDLPIPILLPLLERADSMIAVDTGPAHAAAALGCPTVALFGESDPVLYRPGGATTPAVALTGRVGTTPRILGISARMVVNAWLRLRSASRARPIVGDSRDELRSRLLQAAP